MTDPSAKPPVQEPAPAGAGAAAASPPPELGHPAPPVFHPWAFLLGLVGIVGGVVLIPVAHAYFADRLGLAAPLAAGLTGLSAAAFAGALGGVVGARCRRLAFYELFAVGLLWSAFTAALVALGPARAPGFLAGLAAQGPLVYALAVGGVGHIAAIAAFVGSSLSFLVTGAGAGAGKADLSFSYELYVARSHLRLSPRMLAALFGVVVVGVAPGVLFVVVWSFLREREERRAYRRGELVRTPRLPATLLMTLFSMAAVALGVWTLVVVLSVMSGFSQDLKSKILGHTAHGMVLSYGQDDFGDWRQVREKTLSTAGVTGATPFTYSEVMVSSGQNLTGAIVKGIDEASVGSVIDLPQSVQSGRLEWLAHPEEIPRPERDGARSITAAGGKPLPGVLLGRQLALSLRAQVGDVVNVLSPFGDLGPTGPQPKSRPFRVAGIFYSGMYEYDSKFAYVDLAEAQRFFGLASVTGLEVKVQDVDAARATMDKVVFALGQWPYYAKDWGDLNRSLFAALQQEKVVMAVILGFMVLVTTFTIIATLIMMVLEKRREIAVLKSMGAGVAAIMRVFVIEGLVLGGVGVLFGLVLGLGTCLLIDRVGIPLNPEIYYIHNLPVVLDAGQIAGVVVAALVFSFLATLYPASKAARLHPVDGLRSE